MKKFKRILMSVAVMFCMAAFILPMTAFAGGGEEYPSEEPPIAESESVTEQQSETNPFIPEGAGTVINYATDEDSKEFYVIETPEGNIFYLVIDRQREGNNVYFLNAVTEEDLLALAVKSENKGESALPDPAPAPIPEPTPEPEVEPEPQKNSNTGMIVFILLAVAGVSGAGYYLKVIKPKQDNGFDDDYDGEDEDSEEIELENEDYGDLDGADSDEDDEVYDEE